jgi:hypothetical protein
VTSDARRLLRDLRRHGWQVRQGRHLTLISPAGRRVAMSRSPSDRRAMENLLASIRRAWEDPRP